MELKAEELDIAPYPAPVKTGMITGKMPSGIIVLHKPSGIFAISIVHREQHKNREAAIKQLTTKLVMTGVNTNGVNKQV
ncbi:peptide chain release factor family protein [Rheinheimera sp.]|uniref:peptide chain release factor family protein n=1 Tax=Rheinheimera sp. TaxID=1869214 RepID=UPI0040484C35